MNKLVKLLVELYTTQNNATALLTRAEINTGLIDLSGAPVVFWSNIIHYAKNSRSLEKLIEQACADYPERQEELQQLLNAYLIPKDVDKKPSLPNPVLNNNAFNYETDQLVINLNDTQKDVLAELLLKCPRMNDSPKEVLARLSDEIRNNIKSSPVPIVHMDNIIETCNNYENGIIQLIRAIKRFEGNSKPMQNIERFIKML